jgi:hypothetical protein
MNIEQLVQQSVVSKSPLQMNEKYRIEMDDSLKDSITNMNEKSEIRGQDFYN